MAGILIFLPNAQIRAVEETSMDNRRFIQGVVVTSVVGALIAAGIAVKKVRAQTTDVQPFTATEINESIAGPGHGSFDGDGNPQIPVPYVYSRIIAVRSDGSVAIAHKWVHSAKVTTDVYTRMVYDAPNMTKNFYDPVTQSVVNHPFNTDQALKKGGLCEGVPDGQIEGFEVVREEAAVETLPDGEIITKKSWNAPKLGCYTLKFETVSLHEGQTMFDITRSLTHIRIGEPDPWFFEVPVGYTTRTSKEWATLSQQYQ